MNNAPDNIHDAVMTEYVRPMAELLAGLRNVDSIAARVSGEVERALRRRRWSIRGTIQDIVGFVQVTPARLEIAAVVHIRRRDGREGAEPLALTIERVGGIPRITAIDCPHFRAG